MSRRRRLLGEVSWLQVAASVLAAVTAAWIASRLGVAGTIVGAALGSFVVTITSAFYNNTLHQGRTLLIQTQTGTMIQRRVEDGEVQEALDEVAEVDSPAKSAQFVDTDKPRLHWKTVVVTTVVVLALAIAAISTYELIAGRTLDGSTGTSLTDTFGVSHHKHKDKPTSTVSTTPPTTPTDTATTTTPTPSASTTTPTPSDTTPTPTDTKTTR
jgi:hypothetical protein